MQYDVRVGRPHPEKTILPGRSCQQSEVGPRRDEHSVLTQHYRQQRPDYGQVRRLDDSSLSQFYRQSQPDGVARPSLHDEGQRYGPAKGGLPYSSRQCEVTSSGTHRTTAQSHTAVTIKTSPDDPDTSALMQSLPLPGETGCFWKSGEDGKGWGPELSDPERVQSLPGHHPAASALFESCDLVPNVVKVEDSINHDAGTPSAATLAPPLSCSSPSSLLSLSSSSSSSPFCVDDHLKRDLLAPRNAGDPKQRRRRRHNTGVSAAPTWDSSNGTRVHVPAAPTSSTPAASTAAGMSPAGVGGYLPARLPFSLPPVPPGYRLVITHRPMADTSDDASQVTQLIIDHPSESTAMIHGNGAPASQQPRTSADVIAPSRPVISRRSYKLVSHHNYDRTLTANLCNLVLTYTASNRSS